MPDSWKDWTTVAGWEVQRMLRRKDFVFATLLTPALVFASVMAVSWFQNRNEDRVTRIAIVRADGSATTLPPLKQFEWITPDDGNRTADELTDAVDRKVYEGAIVLPGSLAGDATVAIIVRRPSPDWLESVRRHLRDQARLERAQAAGLDAGSLEALDAEVSLEERLTRPERETTKGDRTFATMTIMLVIISLFTSITYMGIGISGEKTSRVTEVVISAISPQAWIDGKVAAYTVIGLVQMAVWAVSLGAIFLFYLTLAPPAVSPAAILVSIVCAVMGLAFFTALFATVMATIKDLQSTSKFQAYLILLPFIPLMVMGPVLSNPDAVWVMVVSQLPVFSPMLMPARLAVNAVAPWEIALSLVLLVVALHLARLAAGHAFRIGMLMYGKELSLPELWRWARSA